MASQKHIVVLAEPGAGKSELLNSLAAKLATKVITAAVFSHRNISGKGQALIIDAFDNSSSRQIVTQWAKSKNVPCLHTGLASDYAEVIWNEQYRVPSATNDDVCDYPLARNLVMLTVATACEVIVGFASKNEQKSYTITLADLSIKPYV